MLCKTQDLRRHLFLALLTTSVRCGSKSVNIIRSAINDLKGTMILSWLYTEFGWALSRAAKDNPNHFTAVLSFAAHDLRLTGCVGGRLGREIKS